MIYMLQIHQFLKQKVMLIHHLGERTSTVSADGLERKQLRTYLRTKHLLNVYHLNRISPKVHWIVISWENWKDISQLVISEPIPYTGEQYGSSPTPESNEISATDNRGSVKGEGMLLCPSRYERSLREDLAEEDGKDNELPKVLCIFSFMVLYEETDETSSLMLS